MSMLTLQLARAEKHLDRTIRYNGKIMTRRQMVDQFKSQGSEFKEVQVTDVAGRKKAADCYMIMKRSSDWVPTGNENHPRTIQYRQLEKDMHELTKAEFRCYHADESWTVLTKTEFKYGKGEL